MTTLTFERWTGDHPRLYCIWNDELKFFPNEAAAQRWASHHGLRAVFEPDQRPCLCQDDIGYEHGTCKWVNGKRPCEIYAEPRGVIYEFLGLTGLEEV